MHGVHAHSRYGVVGDSVPADALSSMTRQHFQAIARVIAAIEDPGLRRRVCLDMIGELCQFNSNFDRYKFKQACGVEEGNA